LFNLPEDRVRFRAYGGTRGMVNDAGPVFLLDDGQGLVSHIVDRSPANGRTIQ